MKGKKESLYKLGSLINFANTKMYRYLNITYIHTYTVHIHMYVSVCMSIFVSLELQGP